MCDTLIAVPEATKYNLALFAKNSDRPPNESQYLDWYPAKTYKPGDSVQCTYIKIPQIQETHAVLLSRPYWMWGAEMGVNQFGLVIGNEAVFSKIPANKEPALLGMDLLRLGLERAKTSSEAVDVITNILEVFGQGGNCVNTGELYYHNSFLIADPVETWVLETVDKHWAARKVKPIYSISNIFSLENQWDRSSAGFREFTIRNKYARSKDQINIKANYSDFIYTTFGDGNRRCLRSRDLLDKNIGEISVQSMASILRDHRIHPDPATGLSGADICMHASFGPIRVSQSTGSMIVLLQKGNPLVFATGTSAPCTGIFKPIWVDAQPRNLGDIPTDQYNPDSLFWSHEGLHREVLLNYPDRIKEYKTDRDELENEFIQGAIALREASLEQRRSYSEDCLKKATAAAEGWLNRVRKIPEKKALFHSIAWRGFNRGASFH